MARIANDRGPAAAGGLALRRLGADLHPARGPDRLARLVRADQRRSGPGRGDRGPRPRRGAALGARAWAPGSSSTPAARTRPTPPSQPIPGGSDGHRARSTAARIPAEVAAHRPGRRPATAASPTTPAVPAGTPREPWPADPYPEPDPERHAFQIRLTVHEQANPDNIGRYRKTLHAYRDDGNLDGLAAPCGRGLRRRAPCAPGSGGEVSPRLFDVDGDNELDVLQATSSGELHALNSDGTPVASFNGGEPVRTDPSPWSSAAGCRARLLTTPRASRCGSPAIGDIDGDRSSRDRRNRRRAHLRVGARRQPDAGLPGAASTDRSPTRACPALPTRASTPLERAITTSNHIKRGFFGSPALADLDADGSLDIVAGAMDQHVYAFDGDGSAAAGLPGQARLRRARPAPRSSPRPRSPSSTATGPPEIVISTNEVVPGDPRAPDLAVRDRQRDPRLVDRLEPRLRAARRRHRRWRAGRSTWGRRRRPAAAGAARP